MGNNNRVDVHVGVKTSELKKGMDDSEKIVSTTAKEIEEIGKKTEFKVDLSNVKKEFEDVSNSVSKEFTGKVKEAFSGTQIGSSIDGMTSKLGNLRGSILLATGALAGMVVGGTVIAAAGLANMAVQTANTNVELARFAALSNTSIQTFQGLSGAAQTFGFNQEKVADMLKDFNEKIGEFASIGSGGAMDFFEQIAVKTEKGALGAKKLAEEMSKMDGVQALQVYVDKLEEAGVNQQQMSFYLESVGSDLTALAPLLINGGKLWKDYQAAMEEAGIITGQEAIEKSIILSAQTQSLQLRYAALKNELATALMPVVSSLISMFLDGSTKGGQFSGVIAAIGVTARVTAVSVIALASGIQALINLMSGALNQLKNIGQTAVEFAKADGIMGKGAALFGGGARAVYGLQATAGNIVGDISTSIAGAKSLFGNTKGEVDSLTQAIINNQKALLDYKGGSGGITTGIGQNKTLNPKEPNGSAAKAKADAEAKARQRAAEQAAKALAEIRYKYATEEEKISLDLQKALSEIEKSKVSDAEKAKFRIVAEKDASDKTKALRVKEFEEYKNLQEERIENELLAAQRIFEINKAEIQAAFDAKKISNVQKYQLEKDLEDKLRELKRRGLEERLELENQMSEKSGKQGNQGQILNNISSLDTEKTVSTLQTPNLLNDAQIKDFEDKFGGLTSRMSNLWDQGIQAMMNGTLTWRNATNAVLTDMAGFFIQKMVTEPIKLYAAGLARRLMVRLGFIKTETAAEVAGQASQTTAVVAGEMSKTSATGMGVVARLGLKAGEAIKSIMMYAWEAMAGAFKAMVSIPYVGPVLAVAAGASALALVGGLAGKIKSARGGYDIPSGVNPVTQLHEEEMVLPKQHANTIRALGKSMAGGGQDPSMDAADVGAPSSINIQAWDSRDLKRFMKKHGRELAGGLKGYSRNFGK